VFIEITALLFVLPWWYLSYQYWRNDEGQVVEVDSAKGIITIIKNEHSVQINKSDIINCDHVFVRPFNRSLWRNYAYLRIKTAKDTFIITHFTVRPEELLEKLGFPCEDNEMFFLPNIDYEKTSPKQKQRNQAYHDEKLNEFLIRYDEYESEELVSIVKSQTKYADYAVAAANEILKNRKINYS
jgi:hypothetical protein